MKVLVTGAGGQLAHAVTARMQVKHQVISLTRKELDLTRYLEVMDVVREVKPDAIINGAAYNDVDGAEDDPVAAMAVNAFGVRALAQAAVATRAILVHFSTDFVFDGNADQPYTEQSIPNHRVHMQFQSLSASGLPPRLNITFSVLKVYSVVDYFPSEKVEN